MRGSYRGIAILCFYLALFSFLIIYRYIPGRIDNIFSFVQAYYHPCTLDSVSVTPLCGGGAYAECEVGETVRVDVVYSGINCPATSYIQIDAANIGNSCTVRDQDRSLCPTDASDIIGINITCLSGTCTGLWTIPYLAVDCLGQTVNAGSSSLYSNNYPCAGGMWISGVTATGSFTFASRGIATILPGWNLISSGYRNPLYYNKGCDMKDFAFYGWNATTQRWDQYYIGSLGNARAYWIKSTKACEIGSSGTEALTTSNVALKRGWNAVGGKDWNLDSVKGSCVVLEAVRWDSASQDWITATLLEADKGYWIKVASDCQFS